MIENKIIKGIEQGLKQQYASGRKDMHIHISDLPNFCARKYCLCVENGLEYSPQTQATFGMYMTRAIGKKVEDIVYESLLKAFGNKNIYHGVKFSIPMADFKVVGEIDLIVFKHIVEVKSLRPEDWESDNISINYIKQVEGYLWGCKKIKLKIEKDFGVLVYVCKTQKEVPVKTMKIKYNKQYNEYMQGIQKDLELFCSTKQLPNKICNSMHSQLARNCFLRNICFREEK